MRSEFEKWCAMKSDCDYREGAWDAWQAATAHMQDELTAARSAALAEGVRSGELERQLAECQALVKVKHDALRELKSEAWLANVQQLMYCGNMVVRKANDALAQTSGTEALDKLIAEAEQRQRERSAALFEGIYTDSSPGYRIDKEILKERK